MKSKSVTQDPAYLVHLVDEHVPGREKFEVVANADGFPYHCVLNQVNVAENNNKFFVIQLLYSQQTKEYAVFFRWGRVGYSGQTNLVSCASDTDAVTVFSKKFEDKTKNTWSEVTPDPASFVSHKGKYTWIHTHNAAVAALERDEISDPVKKVPTTLSAFIELLTDMEKFGKDFVTAFAFDTNKLPLGKLSEATIEQGLAVLRQLEALLEPKEQRSREEPPAKRSRRQPSKTRADFDDDAATASGGQVVGSRTELGRLSSVYYTLIPHDFKFARMSQFVLDSLDKVKTEFELVESLVDVQVLNRAGDRGSRTLLASRLSVVKKNSKLFKLVEQAQKTTHASTHNTYTAKLLNLYRATHPGEDPRDEGKLQAGEEEEFRGEGKKLLWHGSRLFNWYSIVSRGLRVPETPSTGAMFDKGIYFTEVFSKAANYCFTTAGRGVVALCEVDLGKSLPLLHADSHASRLMNHEYSSTFGVGKTTATTCKTVGAFGLALGPVVASKRATKDGDLLYNEFVVYDKTRVKIRYLAEVEFTPENDYF